MDTGLESYQGCLLGMAVGDAMGFAVDGKTWEEICRDYGPNGLLGYDLVNDRACITSYTQVAAFTCNGLILAKCRGRRDAYLKFAAMALKEWARSQVFPRDPEKSYCWVAKLPYMRQNLCRDLPMFGVIRDGGFGSVDAPRGTGKRAGALPEAVIAGLYFDPAVMEEDTLPDLGAELVAMTHGDPSAFLAGAVTACCIRNIADAPSAPLCDHFVAAVSTMVSRYASRFPEAETVAAVLMDAIALSQTDTPAMEAMESLQCHTALSCLAGAMYAALAGNGDFDAAMIVAVNHSGLSSAVGALAGAMLGTALGAAALPDFYLDSLQPADMLRELAADLRRGTPATTLFDDDWDQKYTQGLPV